MAYTDTFIQIAPDSTTTQGIVPENKRAKKTIHLIQYELLTEKPYHYTHQDLIFAVYVKRQDITEDELAENRDAIWADLFKKEHPCMRASALTKKYGWGAHYDEQGKIALYPMESDKYQSLCETASDTLYAMRTSRKK